MTWPEVTRVLEACRDPGIALPRIHAVMSDIRARRSDYLGAHRAEFNDEEATFYREAMLQECEASWWLRANRYSECDIATTPPSPTRRHNHPRSIVCL